MKNTDWLHAIQNSSHSIVITEDALRVGFYTVTATNYVTGLSVKSCLWPSLAEAQAEAKRIEASWKYGTLPTTAERGRAA